MLEVGDWVSPTGGLVGPFGVGAGVESVGGLVEVWLGTAVELKGTGVGEMPGAWVGFWLGADVEATGTGVEELPGDWVGF
jgi:hypothetical protein